MLRYIDADKLEKEGWLLVRTYSNPKKPRYICHDLKNIDEIPSADVRENVRWEWMKLYDGNYKCSNCGDWWGWDGEGENEIIKDFLFCPNCGSYNGGKTMVAASRDER